MATLAPARARRGSSVIAMASGADPANEPASWPIALSPRATNAPLRRRSLESPAISGMMLRPIRPEAPSIAMLIESAMGCYSPRLVKKRFTPSTQDSSRG